MSSEKPKQEDFDYQQNDICPECEEVIKNDKCSCDLSDC